MKILKPLMYTLIIVFLVAFVMGFQMRIAHSPAGWSGALMISLVVTAFAAAALLILGYPVHIMLKRLNKDKLSYYSLSGALFGLIIVFLFLPFGNDGVFQGSCPIFHAAFSNSTSL